ncbi:MAG: P-loop NTPase fold protein [Marinoscillum sp.]
MSEEKITIYPSTFIYCAQTVLISFVLAELFKFVFQINVLVYELPRIFPPFLDLWVLLLFSEGVLFLLLVFGFADRAAIWLHQSPLSTLFLYFIGATASLLFIEPNYFQKGGMLEGVAHTSAGTFLFLFLVVCSAAVVRAYFRSDQTIQLDDQAIFVSDAEESVGDRDFLSYWPIVEDYGDKILNHFNADSMVFGIDAPWGAGKTTFVNFLKSYWHKSYGDKVKLVYFSPLNFSTGGEFSDAFVDQLSSAIAEFSPDPETRFLARRYGARIKGSGKISVMGLFEVPLQFSKSNISTLMVRFSDALKLADHKIVVVVDDLDRIPGDKIKSLLFLLNKSFQLPNISYIVCYDTNELQRTIHDHDSGDALRFLEKFVNIKIMLPISSARIRNYLSKNINEALKNNSLVDPKRVEQILSAVQELMTSEDWRKYRNFFSDLRKLKIFLNTLLCLDLDSIVFDQSDIDEKHLVRFILLYNLYRDRIDLTVSASVLGLV